VYGQSTLARADIVVAGAGFRGLLVPLTRDTDFVSHGVQLFVGIRNHVAHFHAPQIAKFSPVHIVDVHGHLLSAPTVLAS
jgi:hypothetical protein